MVASVNNVAFDPSGNLSANRSTGSYHIIKTSKDKERRYKMKKTLIMLLIQVFMSMLSSDLFKKAIAYLKEKIEAYVEGTDNTIDDFIYKALIGSVDELRVVADGILDFAEDFVLGTASKMDDMIVLPILKMIREAADIPDDD